MAWLLDTILPEIRRLKQQPQSACVYYGPPLGQLYISVVTLAEFRFGIHLLSHDTALPELEHWLTSTVRLIFDRRIRRLPKTLFAVAHSA